MTRDPDRPRGWLLCPCSSVPAAAGRGLRPHVFPAHRPGSQLQVRDSVMGRRPVVGIAYIHTGPVSLFTCPFLQSGEILCRRFRFRLALPLPDSRSQVLSRTTNFAARIFSSGNVVCKCHAKQRTATKKTGRCAHCFLHFLLLPLKRAARSYFLLQYFGFLPV